LGSRVQGPGFRVKSEGFMVEDLRFKVTGTGSHRKGTDQVLRVEGLGLRF